MLTGRELQDAALHVGYEIDAMVQMALRLHRGTGDAILDNSLLESTLVHCRNLIEFLGPNHQKDDIVPEDFVGGWDPADARIPPAALKSIHKHLAHLTKTRVTDGQVEWPFTRIARDVLDAMGRFVDHCQANGSAATTILRAHYDVAQQRIRQIQTPSEVSGSTGSTDDPLRLGDFR
jgi:hypothetical protein